MTPKKSSTNQKFLPDKNSRVFLRGLNFLTEIKKDATKISMESSCVGKARWPHSAVVSEWNGLGSSPGQGHIVLCSCAFLHPGV